MQTVEIRTLEDLDAFAKQALAEAAPSNRATIFALSGELGAGKTAFVQAIGRAFGISETIMSPTFLVMRRYALPAGSQFDALVHIDAYRVEDPEELSVLGFSDIVNEHVLLCIEWPERVADLMPKQGVTSFSFTLNPDGSRTISYGKN